MALSTEALIKEKRNEERERLLKLGYGDTEIAKLLHEWDTGIIAGMDIQRKMLGCPNSEQPVGKRGS